MKRMMLLAVLLVMGIASVSAHARVSFGISFGVFYSSLEPYGEWIAIGQGVYGWRPVHGGFPWRPYHHGRWIWTDDGWYWASDEPWAWAVYHYGRWHYDDYYGWIWIPGSEWAPAWVEWRFGGSCVGWAPLGPYAIFDGVYGIRYATSWVVPVHHWTFVDVRHMGAHDLAGYVYPVGRNRNYVLQTEPAGNVRFRSGRVVTDGPDRSSIERRTGRRIERADVVGVPDRSREGIRRDNGREVIRVYRPDESPRGAGADRLPDRPARVREPGRRVIPLPGVSRDGSSERREYQPAHRSDDWPGFRTHRPEPSAPGRPETSVRREARDVRPESGNPRIAKQAGQPRSGEEAARGRGENRSSRENRDRR